MPLRVRNWDKVFENNRSRQVTDLRWIAMPNHHDGDRYLELMDHPNAAAHYGCWSLVTQVASKCHPRGTLVKSDGKDHTPESIARMVRVTPEIMREAITRLLLIGLLEGSYEEIILNVTSTSVECHEGGIEGRKEGMEGKNGMEEKEVERSSCSAPIPAVDLLGQSSEENSSKAEVVDSSPVVLTFPTSGSIKTWDLRQSKIDQYKKSFPGLDIGQQVRTARQWCEDNLGKRKTARGMAAFLGRWLASAQERIPLNGNGSRTNSSNSSARPRAMTVQESEELNARLEAGGTF